MNKKLLVLTMLPLISLSFLPLPALAMPEVLPAEPPAYSIEMISEVVYKGVHAIEHKWYVVYDSNHYTVKIYSDARKMLGWKITKDLDLAGNVHVVVSERDFVSKAGVDQPLFGYETVRYFDYEEYRIKEHNWRVAYDNDYYTLKVFTEEGKRIFLGWQIFKNGQLISSRRFI